MALGKSQVKPCLRVGVLPASRMRAWCGGLRGILRGEPKDAKQLRFRLIELLFFQEGFGCLQSVRRTRRRSLRPGGRNQQKRRYEFARHHQSLNKKLLRPWRLTCDCRTRLGLFSATVPCKIRDGRPPPPAAPSPPPRRRERHLPAPGPRSSQRP